MLHRALMRFVALHVRVHRAGLQLSHSLASLSTMDSVTVVGRRADLTQDTVQLALKSKNVGSNTAL